MNEPLDIYANADRTAQKTWQGMGSAQAPWFTGINRRKPLSGSKGGAKAATSKGGKSTKSMGSAQRSYLVKTKPKRHP